MLPETIWRRQLIPKLETYWTGSLIGLAKFTVLAGLLLGLTVGLTVTSIMAEGLVFDGKILFLILVGLNFSIYYRLLLRRLAVKKAVVEGDDALEP